MDSKWLEISTLEVVLRMSRCLGIAPVIFTRNGLQRSRCLEITSYLLFSIINFMLVLGLILDFLVDPSRSIRMATISSSYVWVVNLCSIMVINIVGVYMVQSRMKCVIHVLRKTQKIKYSLGYHDSKQDTKWRIGLITLIIGNVLLLTLDIYTYVFDTIVDKKEAKVLILYMFFYYEYLCLFLYEIQFIAVALRVQCVLRAINIHLSDLTYITEIRQSNKMLSIKKNLLFPRRAHIGLTNNHVQPKRIIDTHTTVRQHHDLGNLAHDLAVAFSSSCDVVSTVNAGFGPLLMLILLSFIFELVVTPYYLIASLNKSSSGTFKLILQSLWCLQHLIVMWVTMEPAYQTKKEIETTESLVSRLLCLVHSSEDPLYHELNIFTAQLLLNKPSYSPLGVCTMSRQLCVTVLGAVTTYLVIILQFQTYDSKRD